MRSMTGFGQASGSNPRHQVAVSLRSVNGRYLDLSLRLKEEYRSLEPLLRRILEAQLHRGRVDATVDVRPSTPLPARVEVQMEVVKALHLASHGLAEKGLIATELALGDLMRLPEVLEVRVEPDTLDGDDEALVAQVAGRALEQLVAAREQEGAQLASLLAERVRELEQAAVALRRRAPAVREALHQGLQRRLRELLAGQPLDEVRLAQEVALLVDRSDVAEELDRLALHLEHFRGVAAGGGGLGKRLDFLSQEILRELNTLGAKCRDAEATRLVLDAKVLCEQLREQVQNVE
ncbi:MAG TPA: YicC/YloC family endoribonuclease [Thermoanaerobaculia bacterium]|nr:YicC/YloC family endoribonuclease [Thermoanaerobaculia bacterium]